MGEIWMRFRSVCFLSLPSSLFRESYDADKICDDAFSKIKEMASETFARNLTAQVQEQKILAQQRRDPFRDVQRNVLRSTVWANVRDHA